MVLRFVWLSKRHDSPQAKAFSQWYVFMRRTNQLLHYILDDVALEVSERIFAANRLDQRPHVVQLV